MKSYGFCTNPELTVKHNAVIQLALAPSWFYFDKPMNSTFHDLTTTIAPPRNLQTLLGLGLKFIPNQKYSTSNISKSIHRLQDDMKLKFFFAGEKDDEKEFDPKMYINSDWRPSQHVVPCNVYHRIQNFKFSTRIIFKKKKSRSNLLWHQKLALTALQKQNTFVIVSCDNPNPLLKESNI